jgi:fructose-bisphosphate aldolase class I
MVDAKMLDKISSAPGFIAALDQSGGSTPGALRLYGVSETDYQGDEEMFRLVHAMRVRIISAPAFSGDKVIGTILFERTMDGDVEGQAVPTYLWEKRGVVPFLKIDKGLLDEENGVQLMKPMPDLDALLSRGREKGNFRNHDALGDRSCRQGRNCRRRRAAVRGGAADHRPRPRPDHRA